MTRIYRCPAALTEHGWQDHVAISVDDDGWIEEVAPALDATAGESLAGPVIPGLPNLHSHAHQRAMAGLAERAGTGGDSFWSWRETMYHYLERIDPDHLYAIARQLYVEMLKAGYTGVAEFQYLHHDRRGRPYQNRAQMTLRCLDAAGEVGIAFTALPVLYRFGGFGGQPAAAAQLRFINDADDFLRIFDDVAGAARDNANAAAGIAVHSLRAVSPELLSEVLGGCRARASVYHIHIAEQQKEVEECVAWSARRPVDWLLDQVGVDHRWCLVHATHMTAGETRRLAASGAVAGLCPSTEANLGDGLFPAVDYIAAGGWWGVGSDSQISVSPIEELRWLEYGARLHRRARNVLAGADTPHTGQALLQGALAGGGRALGRAVGCIAPGRRADFIVLDGEHPRLYGRRGASLVDSLVFSGNDNLVRDVFVGGRRVIEAGRHALEETIAGDYRRALDDLER